MTIVSMMTVWESSSFDACAITAPIRDQTALLAKRPRSESAAHMSPTALVVAFHDLISVGIKTNLSAQHGTVWYRPERKPQGATG